MNDSHWRTLREMVEQWAQIVAQVERGYTLTFDDYLNDLDLRRIIDEQLRATAHSPHEAIPESLVEALVAVDDRFRRATTESPNNVWGAENERDEGWSAEREWYYYRWPEGLK